jgi:hypothetical protein
MTRVIAAQMPKVQAQGSSGGGRSQELAAIHDLLLQREFGR